MKSHGHTKNRSKSPTYYTWTSMKDRCNRESYFLYKNYGGRGITYCEEWETFDKFLTDMGERPDGLTLDRLDVNGNYCPENCKWSNKFDQARNRRNMQKFEHQGKDYLLVELAEIYGIPSKIIQQRMKRDGMTLEQALTKTKRKWTKNVP